MPSVSVPEKLGAGSPGFSLAMRILRSPEAAQRIPGISFFALLPDCAALHPGYLLLATRFSYVRTEGEHATPHAR